MVRAGLHAALVELPELELGERHFRAAIVRVTENGVDLARAAWPDVLLAEAVLQGVPKAYERLRRLHGQRLHSVFKRFSGSAVGDDVEAHFWAALAAPTQGESPLLSRYFGRGALSAWLVVTATRMAQKASKRNREDSTDEEVLFERVAVTEDELKFLRERYRPDFSLALKQAFVGLSPRARNLLRHHYLDGVETPVLGRLYGVHRTTALRWLDEARQDLARGFREALGKKLNVPQGDVESIARLFRSHLDLSLPLEWSAADPRKPR